MLNIKDKSLRHKLGLVGILGGCDDYINEGAFNLVSKVNAANQKLDAIAEHLGLVFIEKKEERHWKLVKKGSPEARISKAQETTWSVFGATIPWTHEEPNVSGVRKKRRN